MMELPEHLRKLVEQRMSEDMEAPSFMQTKDHEEQAILLEGWLDDWLEAETFDVGTIICKRKYAENNTRFPEKGTLAIVREVLDEPITRVGEFGTTAHANTFDIVITCWAVDAVCSFYADSSHFVLYKTPTLSDDSHLSEKGKALKSAMLATGKSIWGAKKDA